MSFDLKKAIQAWKKGLSRHRGFEESHIDELEDHLIRGIEEEIEKGATEEEAFDLIVKRDFQSMADVSEEYYSQRSVSRFYGGLMINYLRVALRSMLRRRGYSLINLLGLVIGLTSVFCIATYLDFETRYDRFNVNHESIYRVNNLFERSSGTIRYPLIPPAVGPAVTENFPEVEQMARLRYAYSVLMSHEHRSFYEDRVFFAEPGFLEMFSFRWLRGDQDNALNLPNTIILTTSFATKYFGDENPIGKTITYNDEIELQVVGVIEDVPEQSHVDFDCLISFNTFKPGPGALEPMTSWTWLGFLTYVQLSKEADLGVLEAAIAKLFRENNQSRNNLSVTFQLQRLSDVYLTSTNLSNPQGGLFKINDPQSLVSLAIVGALILLVAFFNYFNITSALLRMRLKEMGIRRVFGASKSKVMTQFGLETLVMLAVTNIMAIFIALWVSQAGLIPPIQPTGLQSLMVLSLLIIVLFSLACGLFFGGGFSLYSAMSLLKGQLARNSSRFSAGRIILLMQFAISSAMIMISMIVVSQLNFFSQKALGYEQEGVLVAKFRSELMHQKREVFKNAVEMLPAVSAVSYGPALDGSTSGSPLKLREWSDDEVIQTAYFGVDYSFQGVIDFELLKGRFFSEQIASDSNTAILVNETLASMLAQDGNPIGKKVTFANGEFDIIGVFKDFHYQSLHHQIGPMALQMWLGQPRNVLIKYQGSNTSEVLSDIEASWSDIFPGLPFDYRILNDQLGQMYVQEKQYADLLKVFTGLAIFIAVLGLFGLSSININMNLKQIGIRRVLGAELGQISQTVSSKFVITILAGVLVAIPLVYWLMSSWLNNYAYSIDLGPGFGFLTLASVLMVSLLTLALQIYRVMNQNPARILRDE